LFPPINPPWLNTSDTLTLSLIFRVSLPVHLRISSSACFKVAMHSTLKFYFV
jgi:hypothetical protein